MKVCQNSDNLVQNTGDIGLLIRNKREKYGLTQVEAAGMCNVGVRFLSDVENGKITLQIEKVLHVLKTFGFDVAIIDRAEE